MSSQWIVYHKKKRKHLDNQLYWSGSQFAIFTKEAAQKEAARFHSKFVVAISLYAFRKMEKKEKAA